MRRLTLLLIAGCGAPAPAPPVETTEALVARTTAFDDGAAIAELERLLRQNPGHPEALLEYGIRLRRAGRIAESEKALSGFAAAKWLPDRFYNAGVLEMNLQRHAEALRLLGYAVELAPRHAPAHVAIARIHLEARRFVPAEEALTAALAARPDDAALLAHRGDARLAQGLRKEALADFERALALDPALASARVGRGCALLEESPARAAEDFSAVLAADPDHPAALLNRGLAFHRMKRPAEAERDLRAALARVATAAGIQALGRVLLERGSPALAVDAFRKALGLCRDDALRASLEEDLARASEALAKEKTP